jgi:thioredoxin-like negative regulator of GroEL
VTSLILSLALIAAVSADSVSTATLNNTASNTVTADNSAPHTPGANTYAAAYQDTQDSGKPLVVLVGASWCPACQSMKTSTMPSVAAQGGLSHVAFAYVNVDAQHDLAGQLMEGSMIPQLVMFEKTADGWKLNRLIGAQSAEAVTGFIGPAAQRAIALKSAAPTQTPTATQPATPAKQPTASHKSAATPTAG